MQYTFCDPLTLPVTRIRDAIHILKVLLDNNQKPIDNIPYPYILYMYTMYRPIIEKQYSN